jgi:imidazolonepropionase-like amidohydrolase
VGMVGFIADGPDEVRRAARENIRRDVDQIKIMASGGAMSPSDELDTTQFTVAEMRAAVEEAQAVGKYVLSHAYSDTAVRRAIEAGVRSIEHGNLIREPAAQAIKDADAFLVPTMVTYEAIYREGKRYGIGDHQIAKIDMARQQSLQGLTYAYKAGCKIGSGSDLLGDMASQRAVEFELKGQVMKPMEVLLSATKVNAELFRMSDKIGSVTPGKYADLIVVEGNPLKNLRALQNTDNLKVIMKGGRLFKQTL